MSGIVCPECSSTQIIALGSKAEEDAWQCADCRCIWGFRRKPVAYHFRHSAEEVQRLEDLFNRDCNE